MVSKCKDLMDALVKLKKREEDVNIELGYISQDFHMKAVESMRKGRRKDDAVYSLIKNTLDMVHSLKGTQTELYDDIVSSLYSICEEDEDEEK